MYVILFRAPVSSRLTHVVDGVELMIMIIATFGQALSGQAPAVGIIGALIVWRFIVRALLSSGVSRLICPVDGCRYWW